MGAMELKKRFDISNYLVVGPENTKGRPVHHIIKEAVGAGFTCVQIRSKLASAKDMIDLTRSASQVIAESDRPDKVALLVDDRLDRNSCGPQGEAEKEHGGQNVPGAGQAGEAVKPHVLRESFFAFHSHAPPGGGFPESCGSTRPMKIVQS